MVLMYIVKESHVVVKSRVSDKMRSCFAAKITLFGLYLNFVDEGWPS